jgi:hypothetical protein
MQILIEHLCLTDWILCDTGQRSEPGARETLDEIDLNCLSESDIILIETAHNSYIFLVTDAAERRGILVGRPIGECWDGNLLGTSAAKEAAPEMLLSKLNVGSRAIFLIVTGDGLRHLLTSSITKLARSISDKEKRYEH